MTGVQTCALPISFDALYRQPTIAGDVAGIGRPRRQSAQTRGDAPDLGILWFGGGQTAALIQESMQRLGLLGTGRLVPINEVQMTPTHPRDAGVFGL